MKMFHFISRAGLPVLLLTVLLLGGCESRQSQKSIAPAKPTPPPREPFMVSAIGTVFLEDEQSHQGTMVYVPGSSIFAITDHNGKYHLSGLEPGASFEVWAQHAGFFETRLTSMTLALTPLPLGPIQIPGPYELERREAELESDGVPAQQRKNGAGPSAGEQSQALRSIQGRVVIDMSEAPEDLQTPDFDEVIVGLDGTQVAEHPAAGGLFSLTDIPAGQYQLLAWAPGFEQLDAAPVNLFAGNLEDVTLVLTPELPPPIEPGQLMGRVELSDHPDDLSGVMVGLLGSSHTSISDQDGIYRLSDVPPGDYILNFMLQGYHTVQLSDVALDSGEEVELEPVVLERIVEYPRVIDTKPAHQARDVLLESRVPVFVRFSKKMRPETVLGALRISPQVDYQAYMGNQHPLSDFDLLYIELAGNRSERTLDFQTRVTVEIGHEAADFEKLQLESDYRFSFVTGSPAIIGTYPENGARNAEVNESERAVIIQFNCIVDPAMLIPKNFTIRPSVEVVPRIVQYNDPRTGWSVARIHTHWREDTEYRIRIRRLRTERRKALDNLPFELKFKTARTFIDSTYRVPENNR